MRNGSGYRTVAAVRAPVPMIRRRFPVGQEVCLSPEGESCLKPAKTLCGKVVGYSDDAGRVGCLVQVFDFDTKRTSEFHPDFLWRRC